MKGAGLLMILECVHNCVVWCPFNCVCWTHQSIVAFLIPMDVVHLIWFGWLNNEFNFRFRHSTSHERKSNLPTTGDWCVSSSQSFGIWLPICLWTHSERPVPILVVCRHGWRVRELRSWGSRLSLQKNHQNWKAIGFGRLWNQKEHQVIKRVHTV